MKRVMIVSAVCILAVAGSYAVLAQQRTPPRMGRMQDGPNQPMGARGGMCPMHGAMMGPMMQKSMVALQDGGVAVLVGNQLMKFDSSLELQGRTEVPIDLEAMQQQMKTMMQNCPMCRQHMNEEPTGQNTQGQDDDQM